MNALHHYQIAEHFEPRDRQNALRTLVQCCARTHPYTGPAYDRYFEHELCLRRHPFRHGITAESDVPAVFTWDSRGIVQNVGEPGISASIGAFIHKINSNKWVSEAPRAFFIWLVKQPDVKNGHHIYIEADFDFETYIVGGMTDFSGTGSRAYNDLLSVIYLMAETFQVSVYSCEVDSAHEQEIEDLVYEAQKEAESEW